MSFLKNSIKNDWKFIREKNEDENVDDYEVVLRDNNGQAVTVKLSEITGVGRNSGFIVDYNDTSTASSPVSVPANTFVDIPNNGAGSFTNLQFLPSNISRLLDTATGKIDPTELNLDAVRCIGTIKFNI